ncbi:hypothetical protein DFJ77DRAFT_440022 [Powellomyces hirtus]|nr:hypothetical protein DFJ77DRAFT_440022 [Powellomyces hirtus]
MTSPPLPSDGLDVNIPTFHMLCERLSTIEISLETVINNAKHQQMTNYGYLDHKLLGYPFPIERRSCELEAREPAKAEYYPWDAIITIEFDKVRCKENHDNVGFCNGNVNDRAFFTPEELRLLEGKDLSSHPPPESLGIRSTETCLCGTAVQRRSEFAFDAGPSITQDFGKCTFLWSCADHLSISLCGGGRDVSEYIAEALRLLPLRGHNHQCVNGVVMEDSNVFLLRTHQTGLEWLMAEEADRKILEERARDEHLQDLGDMRKHSRFVRFLPRYIRMFGLEAR